MSDKTSLNSSTTKSPSTVLPTSVLRPSRQITHLSSTKEDDIIDEDEEEREKQRKRDKVMSFLKKIGRVSSNKDYTTAIGVDEGPAGKKQGGGGGGVGQIRKSSGAYKWCTDTGIIDDMTETFPKTSSGCEWNGFTDQVMGGVSMGVLTREVVAGRTANLMKGKVSLLNNGGFIQMATTLATDPAVRLTVDASTYDGVELDVLYKGDEEMENFNVHLRNPACLRQFSSYRSTFQVANCNDTTSWQTVRLPWSSFKGYGPGSESQPFDATALRRIGIVAIGKEMDVYLAVSAVRFYNE